MRAMALAQACEQAGHVARLLSTHHGERAIAALVSQVDCLIVSGASLVESPSLWTFEKPVMYDAYCPFHIEQLEQNRDIDDLTRAAWIKRSQDVYALSLQRADKIICASQRQRDLIIGQILQAGRVIPMTFDRDRTLQSLVTVVPFGSDDQPPLDHYSNPFPLAFEKIAESDPIVLWAGGIYEWLDAETVIRAIAHLAASDPTIRLVFMGVQHPNGEPQPAVKRAMRVARALGLLDVNVFFHRQWVEPHDRAAYLVHASVGVCAAPAGLEADYAFRTRYLDHFWAGLPTVCTAGDELASLIDAEQLGLVVPPSDDAAMADAIRSVLHDDILRRRFVDNTESIRDRFLWSRVSAPVVRWVDEPTRAPDWAIRSPRLEESRNRLNRSRGWRVELRAIARTFEKSGFRGVWRKARHRVSGR
jgi:hypothetical protein